MAKDEAGRQNQGTLSEGETTGSFRAQLQELGTLGAFARVSLGILLGLD